MVVGVVSIMVTGTNVCGVVLMATNVAVFLGGALRSSIYLVYFFFGLFTYIKIFSTIIVSRKVSRADTMHTHPVANRARVGGGGGVGGTTTTKSQFLCRYIKEHGYTIPLMITSSYLVLVIFPVIGNCVCALVKGLDSHCFEVTFHVWLIGYSVNNITDALVYIFGDRDVYKHLKRKLSTRNRGGEAIRSRRQTIVMDIVSSPVKRNDPRVNP